MSKPIGRPRSCECGECPKCKKRIYMRKWYATKTPEQRRALTATRDPERIRERDRQRGGGRGTPPTREHRYANQAVYRAKKRGDIVSEPCLFCDAEKVVAHHHDYSKPLVVTWLCRHHHGRIHQPARTT